MPEVSVVIPAGDARLAEHQLLEQTIEDLLKNSRADTHVIAVLEGYWPERIIDDERVHYVHHPVAKGMRGAINAGVSLARSKYIMKCDAHCCFSEGYDETLLANIEDDWIAVPRRFNLIPETWTHGPKRHDYQYLCFPDDPNDRGGPTLHGRDWGAKNTDRDLLNVMIDDLMSAQGSCWFMNREYFHWLELLDEAEYGPFSNEFQEIGLKCWLSGGRVIRNKNAWYAHLHKGKKFGRGWYLSGDAPRQAGEKTNKWLVGRNFSKQDRDFRWILHRFWPVPEWPEESMRLVFNRRRGGSGDVRGTQVAEYFKARLNLNEPKEDWHYDWDINIWVKQEPRHLEWPGKHYLDVMDEERRVGWLKKHPECGVIAASLSGQEYLKEELGRDGVILIPYHHCNFNRLKRTRNEVTVAGVCGGPGAIQCDLDKLTEMLRKLGLSFVWYQDYKSPDDIVKFYQSIDVQIVWRTMQRPLKDPEKIINAMSVGVPTIAYPEIGYREVEGLYSPVTELEDIAPVIETMRQGWDYNGLTLVAEDWHIDTISKLYGQLL